jgi:polysaccharide export outer membrane protein
MNLTAALVPLGFAVAACSTGPSISPDIPTGQEAYARFPASSSTPKREEYRLSPMDKVDVTVFDEPDLSSKGTAIDASGNINLPLVGSILAAGKTQSELSRDLAAKLGQKYLRNPQVTVSVVQSGTQTVTVQGEVTEPGVYPINGPTSLLQAIAIAKGETKIAALKKVVVFRTLDGKRYGAVFDVSSIRTGRAQDPEILGNDLIIVGTSPAKSAWHDLLTAAPLLNVFRPIP